MECGVRFELTNNGFADRSLNHWGIRTWVEVWDLNPPFLGPQPSALTIWANSNILARADGVEPTPTESESVVLPLDYTPKWQRGRDLNPHGAIPPESKSGMTTNSITPLYFIFRDSVY